MAWVQLRAFDTVISSVECEELFRFALTVLLPLLSSGRLLLHVRPQMLSPRLFKPREELWRRRGWRRGRGGCQWQREETAQRDCLQRPQVRRERETGEWVSEVESERIESHLMHFAAESSVLRYRNKRSAFPTWRMQLSLRQSGVCNFFFGFFLHFGQIGIDEYFSLFLGRGRNPRRRRWWPHVRPTGASPMGKSTAKVIPSEMSKCRWNHPGRTREAKVSHVKGVIIVGNQFSNLVRLPEE